ncbi:MAG: Ig-like domain-containing protein [Bacteroidota bacterium]
MDVVFNTATTDIVAPVVTSTSPNDHAIGINVNASFNVTFNENVNPATVSSSTIELRDGLNTLIPVTISYNQGLYKAVLTPVSPLSYYSKYTVTIKGGASGVKIWPANAMVNDILKTFSTEDASVLSYNDGPGGPILVVTSSTNPFSRYSAEILRAEGLNEFAVMDVAAINATILNTYDVVVQGEITVTAPQVTMFTNWVNAGGTLIAFKPGAPLNSLMGLTAASGTLSDKYLLVNTASEPGTGIVGETIQFHGDANLHTLNGATSNCYIIQ